MQKLVFIVRTMVKITIIMSALPAVLRATMTVSDKHEAG
jgi:hypothetical protein